MMSRLSLLSLVGSAAALVEGPWSDKTLDPGARADKLVDEMTLDEQLAMLHGPATYPHSQCTTNSTCAYVGNVVPNVRLDIPPINFNDGPQGFRTYNDNLRTTTAWPAGLTMAASWDLDAMLEWGTGMGKEFHAKGANVQLGPGLCLARVPRNGRNFEYASGEDPFLGNRLVRPLIEGIQSQKVVANAKHYAFNNQETSRHSAIMDVDERTRFEMYYPPFEGASEAGVGSVMCSYNKIADHKTDASSPGQWSCENPLTLKGELKGKTGFKGWVVSDWEATHSTSIMAGLDQEMPNARWMGPERIKDGISKGTITKEAVRESVYRMLRALFAVGVMDEPSGTYDWARLKTNTTTAASIASARRLAGVSTVLLKNNGVLPLPKDAKSIAVLGFGDIGSITHGGGSGAVSASSIATPLAGIQTALQAAGSNTVVSFNNGTDINAAAALAAGADYAIVFVGTLSHEGGDRAGLSLDVGCNPSGDPEKDNIGYQCVGNHNQQDAMIGAVVKANKNTIVVASVPGAILTPWREEVAALLTNFMPGQQAGTAIADVLFGAVNPSGKLPLTWPAKEGEQMTTPEQWPGLPDPRNPTYANYTEGLLVGYRWYDANSVEPAFAFGHGLSYTTFSYASLKASATSVSVEVTNTGKLEGAEVAQLYLGFPAVAGEPPQQLKGFAKVSLKAGETKAVSFPLTDREVSVWDVTTHDWFVHKGDYAVTVGGSSRDSNALKGKFTV